MQALRRAVRLCGVRSFAEAVRSDQLVVRMYTPTISILDNSSDVENIIYDSLDGGKSIINASFMPVQTTLNPGVIEINYKGGQSKRYVHIGGIIQKNPNNTVDCALFEAYDKDDIDWEALKKSDAFVQEPLGDSSAESEYLRKIGQTLRDEVALASNNL